MLGKTKDETSTGLKNTIIKTQFYYSDELERYNDLSKISNNNALICSTPICDYEVRKSGLNKVAIFLKNNHVIINQLKKAESSDKEGFKKAMTNLKNKAGVEVGRAVDALVAFDFNVDEVMSFRSNDYKSVAANLEVEKEPISINNTNENHVFPIEEQKVFNLKSAIEGKECIRALVTGIDEDTYAGLLKEFSQIVKRDSLLPKATDSKMKVLFELVLEGPGFDRINQAKIEAIDSYLKNSDWCMI
jgi:hypothetical protein